jgi:hypothetical protein
MNANNAGSACNAKQVNNAINANAENAMNADSGVPGGYPSFSDLSRNGRLTADRSCLRFPCTAHGPLDVNSVLGVDGIDGVPGVSIGATGVKKV